MGDFPFGGIPPLQLQAATPESGFALQNATPTIISWTVPNDGQQHRFALFALILVSVNEVGGQVQIVFTGPGASATTRPQVFAAGLTASTSAQIPSTPLPLTVAPGTTVSLVQNTALTGGAAVVNAEIWGS